MLDVDADSWTNLEKVGSLDQLDHNASYLEIYKHIKRVVEGP